MNLSDLAGSDLMLHDIVCIKQRWRNNRRFSYMDDARPDNGLTLILCSGATYYLPDGRTIEVNTNSLVLIPQGINYQVVFHVKDEVSFASLLINYKLSDITDNTIICGTDICTIAVDTDGDIKEDFLSIIDTYCNGNVLMLKSAVYKLLNRAACMALDSPSVCRINNVISYVENHLNTFSSIPALAKQFAMSEALLRRMFRAQTGYSPIDYINKLKVSKAKELLRAPETSIETICEQLGFYDASYFYKVFRKNTGTTPIRYRRNYLHR